MQAPEITPGSDAMVPPTVPLLLHAVCRKFIPFVCCRGLMGVQSTFLSLVTLTLTFDLTLELVRARDQTCLPVNLVQICSAAPEIFK